MCIIQHTKHQSVFNLLVRSFDESPRWLIVSGHHDRALQVLQKAARWNKASLPPEHQLRALMNDILSEVSSICSHGIKKKKI